MGQAPLSRAASETTAMSGLGAPRLNRKALVAINDRTVSGVTRRAGA